LYEQPASRFVADFIGDANLVAAELIEERGERALVRLGTLDLDLVRRGARMGPVTLAVRSESITLHTVRPDTPALGDASPKRLTLVSIENIRLRRRSAFLFVIDRSDKDLLAPGREIWITLAARGVVIVPE